MIDKFYDPTTAVAPITADMHMRGQVDTAIFVRLRWVKSHPGEKFNKYDYHHVEGINGLKWLYNIMGRDWTKDPMFKNFTPPWATSG